jgi:putative DNA primase/helicase
MSDATSSASRTATQPSLLDAFATEAEGNVISITVPPAAMLPMRRRRVDVAPMGARVVEIFKGVWESDPRRPWEPMPAALGAAATGSGKYRVDNFTELTEKGARILFGSPDQDESNGSETVFKTDRVKVSVNTRTGAWFDFKAPKGDSNKYEGGKNCFSLVMRELGYSDKGAVWEWLATSGLVESRGRRPTRVKYGEFRGEDGEILYREGRKEYADSGKRIQSWGELSDGNGGYITGKKIMDAVDRVPYRLPEITKATTPIIIAEGFPKADLLVAWGFEATAVYGGAGGWDDEEFGYSRFFAGKDVVLLADTDGPGRRFADRVGRSLTDVASRTREAMLPRLEKPKEDIVEWKTKYGGSAAELRTLIDAAPPWVPPPPQDYDDEGEPLTGLPPKYSEEALAIKFADRHAGELIYVHKFGRWYKWDGAHWKIDEVKETFSLARDVCRETAAFIKNQGVARSVASAHTRAAVVSLAGEDPRLRVASNQIDSDPWLLCTPGGTVELKTGTLRENRPSEYMTKTTAASPDFDAGCPLWMAYLDKITGGDEELKNYLQRMSGYFLTGVTIEHALFFLYGEGRNGKTTYIMTISGIMGSYYKKAEIETFTETQGDRHPTEVAMLHGARLVASAETEEGRRWAESRIKALTGGDEMNARFMRQDFFSFIPEFKLTIYGNHKPTLRTVDEAIRSRMNMIPFAVTIPKEERDPYFVEKLKQEWPAILAWMIRGCLAWQKEKLRPPASVISATETYLKAEDSWNLWFEDCCARDGTAFAPTTWLFHSWKTWCERAGLFAGNEKRFGQRLETEGFEPDRKSVNKKMARGYVGIRLVSSTDRPEEEGQNAVNPREAKAGQKSGGGRAAEFR